MLIFSQHKSEVTHYYQYTVSRVPTDKSVLSMCILSIVFSSLSQKDSLTDDSKKGQTKHTHYT